jgi:RNA polymerase sigma factor (TIGR02999 family)
VAEPDQPVHEVTRILEAIQRGDLKAADELLPIVYQELRRLAGHRLSREKPGQTLQATALVHEAYLRLVGSGDPGWENRGHFFSAAAEAMRRILVDRARRKGSQRRGKGAQRVDLADAELVVDAPSDKLLALDEALSRLEAEDSVKANLVKLRYFTGLTLPEAAKALGVSLATAGRYWAYARGWLRLAMSDRQEHTES